jgi:hypothetical protein
MKTREIDVWFREDNYHIMIASPVIHADLYRKAKLVIPVEPETREIEAEVYDVDKVNGKQFVTLISSGDHKWLEGRRWKCRFEEVV